MDTKERILKQLQSNDMILYMKGTPQFPQCGYSGRVIGILNECKARFAYINVLENLDIRQTLPTIANWPTYPQLYIKGELVGGCDIITELFNSGELQTQLSDAGVVGDKMQTTLA